MKKYIPLFLALIWLAAVSAGLGGLLV